MDIAALWTSTLLQLSQLLCLRQRLWDHIFLTTETSFNYHSICDLRSVLEAVSGIDAEPGLCNALCISCDRLLIRPILKGESSSNRQSARCPRHKKKEARHQYCWKDHTNVKLPSQSQGSKLSIFAGHCTLLQVVVVQEVEV